MAIKFAKRTAGGIDEYIVTFESEIALLPTNVSQGSSAFCITSASLFMFEADSKTWMKI